jgi:predicted dehydrogenase
MLLCEGIEFVSKTDRVGIAIIGSGGIAQSVHLPAYAKLRDEGKVEIVAVADANEQTAKTAAEKFEVPHIFTDYHELLKLKQVDAVSICTPNFLHKQPTLDAFDAGKHVLVEKPIGLNGIEGAEMVAAGHAAGKKLQVGLNMRFGSAPQAIKKFVDAGKLGDIYYARAHALRRRGVPTWGVFTEKDKQGGGPLIDIGVHILDMTLWLLGHPKPISVSGQTYRQFGNRPGIYNNWGPWDPTKYTVEDFAVGQVKFDNGATLTLESSFVANIAKEEFSTALLGSEGGVFLDLLDNNNTRVYREEEGTLTDTLLPSLPNVSSHELEIRAFVQAILDDTPPLIPGEQALMVTQILDAIYESSETGREVIFAR